MILRFIQSFRHIDQQQLKWSMGLWFAFLASQTIYCPAYNQFVTETPWTIWQSMVWAITQWFPWLVLTPIICHSLTLWHNSKQFHTPQAKMAFYIGLSVTSILTALLSRILVEFSNENSSLTSSLVYFLPHHTYAYIAVILAWFLGYFYTAQINKQHWPTNVSAPLQTQSTQLSTSDCLKVCKGNSEMLIQISDISSITASGNYVDIATADATYILRSTMKQLELSLPSPPFLRVHRSHLINVQSIQSIQVHTNSQRQVLINNGEKMNISKSYWQKIKQFVPPSVPEGANSPL